MKYISTFIAFLLIFDLINCSTLPQKDIPSKICGGWFGPKCNTTANATFPTPLKERGAELCGGLFQKACEPSTTPTPICGGWFQPACDEAPTLKTPDQQNCGGMFGFFQRCPTATPLVKSCGWLNCEDLTTPTPTEGWVSGMFSSLYGAVGSVSSKVVSVTLNVAIDFLLSQVKLFGKVANMNVVPLPDIDIPLYPGARFNATGGYFKSLSSISRGGDIIISRNGLVFIIDFPVEIKDMEIGFKYFKIAVLFGMGMSGELKVGVKENKINIRIRLTISTSCAINVEKVDLTVLDGFDIQMNYGCQGCGFITDKVTNYLINYLKNTIRGQIQSQIDNILKKTLSENALICSKFMGL